MILERGQFSFLPFDDFLSKLCVRGVRGIFRIAHNQKVIGLSRF